MLNEGELWSFFRKLISQGTYIHMDAVAGKYQSSEEVFARIDEAARERVDEFLKGRQDPPLGMEAHSPQSAQETRVRQNTGAPDCEKCGGAGWLRGKELDDADHDTATDTMTKYPCDGEQCRALNRRV